MLHSARKLCGQRFETRRRGERKGTQRGNGEANGTAEGCGWKAEDGDGGLGRGECLGGDVRFGWPAALCWETAVVTYLDGEGGRLCLGGSLVKDGNDMREEFLLELLPLFLRLGSSRPASRPPSRQRQSPQAGWRTPAERLATPRTRHRRPVSKKWGPPFAIGLHLPAQERPWTHKNPSKKSWQGGLARYSHSK